MPKRWKKYSGELIQEIRHYRNKLAIYQATIASCIHCKADFQKRHGEANKYCSVKCHDEFRVMKWLPCSVCMARAGIGSYMAAKLLGIIDASKIRMHWKRRGIKRVETAGIKSGWLRAIKESSLHEDERKMREAAKAYETACMDDIRSHRSHHDWSYIWYKEVSRIKSNNKYQNMSLSERRKANRKLMRNRCPIKQRAKIKEWKRKTRIKNPAYMIIENFRTRLWMVAKGKNARTMDLVGCSLADFRSHIEKHFKHGMTWENYGTHWHVDHTIPVSSFDHNDPKQLKQCWHWTNLRPMTATRNLRKGSRITQPQMELLLCAH